MKRLLLTAAAIAATILGLMAALIFWFEKAIEWHSERMLIAPFVALGIAVACLGALWLADQPTTMREKRGAGK